MGIVIISICVYTKEFRTISVVTFIILAKILFVGVMISFIESELTTEEKNSVYSNVKYKLVSYMFKRETDYL